MGVILAGAFCEENAFKDMEFNCQTTVYIFMRKTLINMDKHFGLGETNCYNNCSCTNVDFGDRKSVV